MEKDANMVEGERLAGAAEKLLKVRKTNKMRVKKVKKVKPKLRPILTGDHSK